MTNPDAAVPDCRDFQRSISGRRFRGSRRAASSAISPLSPASQAFGVLFSPSRARRSRAWGSCCWCRCFRSSPQAAARRAGSTRAALRILATDRRANAHRSAFGAARRLRASSSSSAPWSPRAAISRCRACKSGFVEQVRRRLAEKLAAAPWPAVSRLQHARVTNLLTGDIQRIGSAALFTVQLSTAAVLTMLPDRHRVSARSGAGRRGARPDRHRRVREFHRCSAAPTASAPG